MAYRFGVEALKPHLRQATITIDKKGNPKIEFRRGKYAKFNFYSGCVLPGRIEYERIVLFDLKFADCDREKILPVLSHCPTPKELKIPISRHETPTITVNAEFLPDYGFHTGRKVLMVQEDYIISILALPQEECATNPLVLNEPNRAVQTGPATDFRSLTVARSFDSQGQNPRIGFSGNYLAKLGFTLGTTIIMRTEPNKITLTVDDRIIKDDTPILRKVLEKYGWYDVL